MSEAIVVDCQWPSRDRPNFDAFANHCRIPEADVRYLTEAEYWQRSEKFAPVGF